MELEVEYIFVQVVSQFFKVIIGLVYLSPTSDFNHFKNKFESAIYDISLKYLDNAIIVGGDLNCKIGSLNQLGEDFFKESNNLAGIRSTSDEKIDKRGREIVELFERNGYFF